MSYNGEIEESQLEAEQLLEDGDIMGGKKQLEEILVSEPGYGRAHNALGWIYDNTFVDYAKAEYHYKLAIKFAPTFPAGYLNYCFLLNKLKKSEELLIVVNKALKVPGINVSSLHNELGLMFEYEGNYKEAIAKYKLAIANSLNNFEIEAYRGNIKRCHGKKWGFFRLFKKKQPSY
ncbi:O-linked GlcNAc transferase [Flammeovirgaceae bacterium SG7u.111]|nr:O-linked GlcNAc transferase [Flammeovirgaceae bacterium SG7u.132]WPO33225.1 O-linked GlcNAc transferase [Flammeovirgaceae bacterium SG7u.111]